ncbi:unnamed protein product, partial [Amoebophrya sp. A25]
CNQLRAQIRQFETETAEKGSSRFRGNSIALLQEEQQRNRFRRRKEKVLQELEHRVREWEDCCQEEFVVATTESGESVLLRDELLDMRTA